MSFGQHRDFTDKWDRGIKKALVKAEKAGKVKIAIENPDSFHGFSTDRLVGQILHWKNSPRYADTDRHGYDKKESKFLLTKLKKIWIITGIVPTVYHKDEDTSENLRGKVVKTQEKLIIEPYDGKTSDYLPEKKIIITHREFQDEVDRIGLGLLVEGRYCLKSNGDYGRITKIEVKEVVDDNLTNGNHLSNPHKVDIMKDEIWIEYEYEKETRIDVRDDIPTFDGKASEEINGFMGTWQMIPEKDIKAFEARITHIEETGELPFDDIHLLGDGTEDGEEAPQTNALMGFDSHKFLQKNHDEMAVRKNDADIIMHSMTRRIQLKKEEVDMILANKKRALANVISKLNETVAVFKKEMAKIFRLITTLEIYMGVDEEVIQITEGEPASDDTPIALRQMLLYMDEECAEFIDKGGLDHRNIEDFDQWIVDSGKYERLVPEEKCVVIMRPRRYMKHYSDNPWVNSNMQDADRLIYILIRNGDNLYRIWTDNIPYHKRLFPKRAELQAMMDNIHELQKEREKADSGYSYDRINDELDEADSEMFYYKRNMLLLQGIVMRTPIFNPLPEGLNMLDVRTHGDHINFIHDEEDTLGDGRPRYKEWLEEINSYIQKGSRIYFASKPCPSPNNFPYRFSTQWEHDHSAPPLPESGVYDVIMKKEWSKEDHEEWIPLEEFEKAQKKWDEIVDGVSKHHTNQHRVAYEISEEDHIKYCLYKPVTEHKNGKGWVNQTRTRKGVKQILVNRYDPKEFKIKSGYYARHKKLLKKDEYKEVLKISYLPDDEVTRDWGRDYGKRKTNITMAIKPEKDDFIINYDALTLEDIDYYLENRIDRPNYLKMMPVLRGLKDKLLEEQEDENNFARFLKDTMEMETPDFKNHDVEGLIKECIQWWKEDVVTVWKRPIAKDNKKAMDMITKRVKSRAKKEFKIKGIDTGVDNTKKVLAWKEPSYNGDIIYIGYGLTKKQFVDGVASGDSIAWKFESNRKEYKGYSKAAIGREMYELKEGLGYDFAKKNKGEVKVFSANERIKADNA